MLLDGLLLSESLFLLDLLEMIQCLLLLGVLQNFLLFFLLLKCHFSLNSQKVFIGLFELFTSLLNPSELVLLPLLLLFKLLFNLFLDKLTLQLFFLHALDIVELEFLQLLRNHLRVLHFLVVLFLQLLSQSLVVLLHFLLLKLFPLQFDFSLQLLLPVLQVGLGVLLGDDVAHQHLRVQGLDLVLVVVEDLVCAVDLGLSQGLLVGFLLGVDFSAFNLFSKL